MADTKISALTALAGSAVEQLADVLAIVDNSTTTTKKILVSELSQALLVSGTEQATTSGTEKDFTIPAWAKRVTVMLAGVSTNGSANLLIQLGDAGGIENSGYTSGLVLTNTPLSTTSSAGYIITGGTVVGSVFSGTITLSLENASAFRWISHGITNNAGNICVSAGSKATSAAMTTVRLTTTNGTDAFDAGAVNVMYE